MDWLAIELLNGLTKLLSLGLDRTPASDVIEITVGTWHEAITTGRVFDQSRDTPRVRAAFVTLAQTAERWPQPRHFLDALPRIEQAALRYEVKPVSPEEAERRMAEIRKTLDENAPGFHVEPNAATPEREGPPLAEVERELQAHYGKSKVAAAGSDA
jgi:hypothetical protein